MRTSADCQRGYAARGSRTNKFKHLLIDTAVLSRKKSANGGKNDSVFEFQIPDLEWCQYLRCAHRFLLLYLKLFYAYAARS
jgi:hypothetical protein